VFTGENPIEPGFGCKVYEGVIKKIPDIRLTANSLEELTINLGEFEITGKIKTLENKEEITYTPTLTEERFPLSPENLSYLSKIPNSY
jgi:hypothetical protein